MSELDQPKPGLGKVVTITVTDAVKVRSLAQAICGLPSLPLGTVHCPAQFGGGYQLTFSVGTRRLPAVTIQASGCEMVTGAGGTRWLGRTPGFWAVFAQTTGIKAPRHTP